MEPKDPWGNFPGYEDWRDARRRKWEERRRRRMERWGGDFHFHGDTNGRLVFGTIILLLGILFLLQNLGVFYVDRLWQFWPVALIAMGVARVVDGRTLERRFWGGITAAAGAVLLANSLGYLPWRVWSLLWPAWLIVVGILILVRGFGKQAAFTAPSAFVHEVSASSDDTLHALAIFGGINRRVQSQDFQGGEAIAVFGGIELDLRGASTTRDELEIEANAVFGGIELIVPDAWDVTVRGTGILGGYEDKTHRVPTPVGVKRPHLTISGGAVFGGVTVK